VDNQESIHTADREFRTASDELKICSAGRPIEFGHDFNKESDGTTLVVESMVSFDGFGKGCNCVKRKSRNGYRREHALSYDQSSSLFPNSMTNSSAVKDRRSVTGNTFEKPSLKALAWT